MMYIAFANGTRVELPNEASDDSARMQGASTEYVWWPVEPDAREAWRVALVLVGEVRRLEAENATLRRDLDRATREMWHEFGQGGAE